MSKEEKGFRTIRGYEILKQKDNLITPSMEDYLEMTCRLAKDKGYVRISDLAEGLNVQPPSASRMAQKLSELGYLSFEKYGLIQLTDQGREYGGYLLKRHETIERFLKMIGIQAGILEETEKIEHFVSPETIKRIIVLVEFMEHNQEWMTAFEKYQTATSNTSENSS